MAIDEALERQQSDTEIDKALNYILSWTRETDGLSKFKERTDCFMKQSHIPASFFKEMLLDVKKMMTRVQMKKWHPSNEQNEIAVDFEEMSQLLSEVIEIIRRNQFMAKLELLIFLLAFLLYSGIDNSKHLAIPERGKISCITVYLLGNDGAHSYNGNGILLTTRRKYTRFSDVELLDEIRPANLPLDVLQRQPTDKEIARLSGKLGQEYRLLAYELGLTRVQLDHLTLDCPTTLLRIERMFFIWRDDIEGNATFEILVKAMGLHGINPDIVCQCLERA